MKGYCEICNKEIEIRMCCSGHECSCMGQPIDPPVCSEKCRCLTSEIDTQENYQKLFQKALRDV